MTRRWSRLTSQTRHSPMCTRILHLSISRASERRLPRGRVVCAARRGCPTAFPPSCGTSPIGRSGASASSVGTWPGKLLGRAWLLQVWTNGGPHSSFSTTPHNSFSTTPHSSFLPPLTVHLLHHPSQFFFYHPSQFIFYHASQFIFYHPSQFFFCHPSQFIFCHPSQFIFYHPLQFIFCVRPSGKRY